MELLPIVISITTLLVLDILWISLFMGPKYSQMIPRIQGEPLELNYSAAILAYLLMVVLLVRIVIFNRLSLLDSVILGLCLYGVYDFTAGAVLKDWDWSLALIDIAWGGFVFGAAYYAYQLGTKL